MNKKLLLVGIMMMFLGTLSSCKNQSLSEETMTFAVDDSEYTVHLPRNWEKVADYQKEYSGEAIFGAKDTKSRSFMFIREQKNELVAMDELKKITTEQLSEKYNVDNMDIKEIEDNDFATIYYSAPIEYKNKPFTLNIFFVSTSTHIINFQFYSAITNNAKREQQMIDSIQSMKQTVQGTLADTETKKIVQNEQRIENEQFACQVTGYRVEDNLLILRYIFTNKLTNEVTPKIEWDKLVAIKQGDTELNLLEVQDPINEELTYLIEQSKKPLSSNHSVECAVIYSMVSKENLTVILDPNEITGSSVVLSINQ